MPRVSLLTLMAAFKDLESTGCLSCLFWTITEVTAGEIQKNWPTGLAAKEQPIFSLKKEKEKDKDKDSLAPFILTHGDGKGKEASMAELRAQLPPRVLAGRQWVRSSLTPSFPTLPLHPHQTRPAPSEEAATQCPRDLVTPQTAREADFPNASLAFTKGRTGVRTRRFWDPAAAKSFYQLNLALRVRLIMQE